METQPEFEPEKRNVALNHYYDEVKLSHKGTPEDSLHRTLAAGMRKMLYDLGAMTETENHELVVMATKAAEKEKLKLQKIRQGK